MFGHFFFGALIVRARQIHEPARSRKLYATFSADATGIAMCVVGSTFIPLEVLSLRYFLVVLLRIIETSYL